MFFRSITNKIFIGIFVISVLFLAFALSTVSRMYTNELERNEIENNLLASNQTKSQFDLIISLSSSASNALNSNISLTASNNSTKYSSENKHYIKNLFKSTLELQPSIHDIHLLNNNGNFITTNSFLEEDVALNNFERFLGYDWQSKNDNVYFSLHDTPIHSGRNKTVLSHITPIYMPNSKEISSILILDLDYDFLWEMFMVSTIHSNEKTMVLSQAGDILFNFPYYTSYEPVISKYPQILKTSSHTQLRENIFGIDSIIVADKMDISDWVIVRIVHMDKLNKNTKSIKNYSIFIILASCITALLYGGWLVIRITKPIKELDTACKKIEGGDFSVRVAITSKDEIGNLQSTVNLMLDKINDYFQNELSDQKKKSKLQLQILQAQINPHFLYNTLDSVKWMAIMQNVNNISEMTSALINLLKYNLGNIEGLTHLENELSAVQNYVTIQKYRYGDSFEVEYDIDKDALSCGVVPFTIQPLVENCIIHAFDDIAENNIIKIKAFLKNDKLYIQIEDNGNGMEKEQMERIIKDSEGKGRFNQIGIQNIIGRIKLQFGDECAVNYKSKINMGTLAEIILPITKF